MIGKSYPGQEYPGQDYPSYGLAARSCSLAVTEAQDVAALAVGVRVSGSMDVTEAQDISAFVAAVRVNSSIAVTEEQDIPAFDVQVGPLDISEIPAIHRGPIWIPPTPAIPAE